MEQHDQVTGWWAGGEGVEDQPRAGIWSGWIIWLGSPGRSVFQLTET
jgi:hypothetical protein